MVHYDNASVTSSYDGPGYVWVQWCGNTYQDYTGTSTVWANWNDDTGGTLTSNVTTASGPYGPYVWKTWYEEEEVKEEKRRLSRAQRQQEKRLAELRRKQELKRKHAIRREQKMAEKRRVKAETSALELLADIIGPDQVEIYNRTGRVLVKGQKYDWLIIREGYRVRVKRLEQGKLSDLCVHLKNDPGFPPTDRVIGFLLHAKANEKHFAKTANASGLREIEERIEGAVV